MELEEATSTETVLTSSAYQTESVASVERAEADRRNGEDTLNREKHRRIKKAILEYAKQIKGVEPRMAKFMMYIILSECMEQLVKYNKKTGTPSKTPKAKSVSSRSIFRC